MLSANPRDLNRSWSAPMDEWLTAKDAARALEVVPDTVRTWAHNGKIRGGDRN